MSDLKMPVLGILGSGHGRFGSRGLRSPYQSLALRLGQTSGQACGGAPSIQLCRPQIEAQTLLLV
jgi:hypothetical protein